MLHTIFCLQAAVVYRLTVSGVPRLCHLGRILFLCLVCLFLFFFFFCNRLNDLFQFCVPRSATSPDTRAKESIKFLFINKIMSKHFRITGMRSGTGGPDT